MKDQFNDIISTKTDEELFDIINNKEDYQQSFFDSAVIESKKRGFSETINQVLKKHDEIERKENKKLKLYSLGAIILFSSFFTLICGAIMMSSNFRKLGNNEKSKSILIFGIIYTLVPIIVINLTDIALIQLLSQIIAMLGGFVLVFKFERFYPKNLEYNNKPVWKILFYALLINVALIYLILKIQYQLI